jgi:hypothetical protein
MCESSRYNSDEENCQVLYYMQCCQEFSISGSEYRGYIAANADKQMEMGRVLEQHSRQNIIPFGIK